MNKWTNEVASSTSKGKETKSPNNSHFWGPNAEIPLKTISQEFNVARPCPRTSSRLSTVTRIPADVGQRADRTATCEERFKVRTMARIKPNPNKNRDSWDARWKKERKFGRRTYHESQ